MALYSSVKLLQLLAVRSRQGSPAEFLQLCDDFALLRPGWCAPSFLCAGISLVASLEELVASIEEVLPEQFALFARHNAHGLPFLLQRDELVARLLPFSAVSQFLSLFDEFLLLLEVLWNIATFSALKNSAFLLKNVVIDGAEALENLHVHLLRSKTDGHSIPVCMAITSLVVCLPLGSGLVCRPGR